MIPVCFDCEKSTTRLWNFGGISVCTPCSGWRFEQAMRKVNEVKMYLFNNELFNAARSFHLPATVIKGNGDIFPDIHSVQVVFDSSVWHGVISNDNIDGSVLMKRTKRKFMPNGELI